MHCILFFQLILFNIRFSSRNTHSFRSLCCVKSRPASFQKQTAHSGELPGKRDNGQKPRLAEKTEQSSNSYYYMEHSD